MFIVYHIMDVATPFMRLGAYVPNEMRAIGDKYFGSVNGFATVEQIVDHKGAQPHGPYVTSGYSMGGLFLS